MKKTLFALVAIVGFIVVATVMLRQPDAMTTATDTDAVEMGTTPRDPEADAVAREGFAAWQKQNDEIAAKGDLAGCDTITDAYARGMCVVTVASKLAMEKEDVTLCDKIDKTLADPDTCRVTVASAIAVKTGSPKVCTSALADAAHQRDCAYQYHLNRALTDKNVSLCGKAADTATADRCTNSYLIATGFVPMRGKDFSCGSLSGDDVKADCALMQKALADGASGETLISDTCTKLTTGAFLVMCAPESAN